MNDYQINYQIPPFLTNKIKNLENSDFILNDLISSPRRKMTDPDKSRINHHLIQQPLPNLIESDEIKELRKKIVNLEKLISSQNNEINILDNEIKELEKNTSSKKNIKKENDDTIIQLKSKYENVKKTHDGLVDAMKIKGATFL